MLSQTSLNMLHNLDLPIGGYKLDIDSSKTNFLQIPIFDMDFEIYSNPNFSSFLFFKNGFLFDVDAYHNELNEFSDHFFNVNNTLLHYMLKANKTSYCIGITHDASLDITFAKQLVSLIVQGNSQFLNEEINLNANRFHFYNYFSFYLGYGTQISSDMELDFKIKFLKGVSLIGFENKGGSLVTISQMNTFGNPFITTLNTHLNVVQNNSNSFFSNLGISTDFWLQKTYEDKFSVYGRISDLGFIRWSEEQYESNVNYDFDGLNYTLEQDLTEEFNVFTDTIKNHFIQESIVGHKLRVLPFSIDIGLNYLLNGTDHKQIFCNYNFQKTFYEYLHTATLGYKMFFEQYNLSIIPMYSLNTLNYTNFSCFFSKNWNDKLIISFYSQNLLGIVNPTFSHLNFGISLVSLF